MPNKSISLSGEVHISTEQVYTTVDALEALKAIGLAYGSTAARKNSAGSVST